MIADIEFQGNTLVIVDSNNCKIAYIIMGDGQYLFHTSDTVKIRKNGRIEVYNDRGCLLRTEQAEIMEIEVKDIVRYNEGWLALMSFYAQGTDWYLGLPAYRSKIEASLAGQKMLEKIQEPFMNIKLVDVVRYNNGYLGIFSFYAQGTTWYIPMPLHRSQIDASRKREGMFSLYSDFWSSLFGLFGI